MARKKDLYPNAEEVRMGKYTRTTAVTDEEPDFIGNAPNYEKFEKRGWDTEKILVWLNID